MTAARRWGWGDSACAVPDLRHARGPEPGPCCSVQVSMLAWRPQSDGTWAAAERGGWRGGKPMHSLPFFRLHSKPACAAADGCACPVLEACASSPQVDSGGDCQCSRGQACICEGVAAPLAPVPIMRPLPPHAPPPPLQGVSEGACGCVRDQHPRGHGGSTRQWALGSGERCMGFGDGPAGDAHTGVTGVW